MNLFFNDSPHILVNNVDMEQYGLCLMERPEIPSPKRQQVYTENKYSERGTTRMDVGWSDIEIDVKFNYLNVDDPFLNSFRKNFYSMRKALFNAKTIRFNDDLPVQYEVKNVVIGDTTSEILEHGIFTATFTCNPFPYKIDDHVLMTFDKNTTTGYIVNDGNYPCFPIIKLTQEVNSSPVYPTSISINIYKLDNTRDRWEGLVQGWQLDFRKDQPLIIDGEKCVAYVNNIPQNEFTQAWDILQINDYPRLDVGEYRVNVALNGQHDINYKLQMDIDRRLVY
jgi:phage-related protein